MIYLDKYRGYAIYVNSKTGYFAAYNGDEGEITDASTALSSNTSMRDLQGRLDVFESSVKRKRVRPVVPIITSAGYRGIATGIHAGTGRPNIKMHGSESGGTAHYDVKDVKIMITQLLEHLKEVRNLEVKLNTYTLPSLGYGSNAKDPDTILSAEAEMKSRWEELTAEDASDASKAQEDHI